MARSGLLSLLGRVFASAVARRLAYVVVAILVGYLSTGKAHAMDEGQAYSTVVSTTNAWIGSRGAGSYKLCTWKSVGQWSGGAQLLSEDCPPGGSTGTLGFIDTRAFDVLCGQKSTEYTWTPPGGKPSDVCGGGCAYTYAVDASDPKGFVYVPNGNVCEIADDNEPVIDTDGDGVPDEKDAFPNDPTESKDTDGDGIGDNADIAPEDPSNGDDKEEGDEKDNQAGGGGTCGAPPSCSGDAIACNTNWQIWRLRCQGTAVGSVTGDVTNCNAAINVTSPDPLANANILLQRKIACKADGGGGNQGDGQQPEWTKVNGMSQDPGKGGSDSDIPGISTVQVNADALDQSGFGGGACVGFVAAGSGTGVSSGFTQTLASPPAFFCDYIGWLKLAIITGAAIYSVIVISKGHA